jgi:hypothetical protein
MITVDVNNLTPCFYATEKAFFNLGGIVDGNKENNN